MIISMIISTRFPIIMLRITVVLPMAVTVIPTVFPIMCRKATVLPVVLSTIHNSIPVNMPRLKIIHVVTVLRPLLHQNDLSLVQGLNRSEIVADILATRGGQLPQFFQVIF